MMREGPTARTSAAPENRSVADARGRRLQRCDTYRGSPSVYHRRYAYYRCLGAAAYRFGGQRGGPKTPVRTELLELAVGQEVCALLAHPERLAEEYRRRVQPATPAKR